MKQSVPSSLVAHVAAKCDSCLLSDLELEELRQEVCMTLAEQGFPCAAGVAEDQPFHLHILESLLMLSDDIDVQLPRVLAEGVSTGVIDAVEPSGVWSSLREGAHEGDPKTKLMLCESNWTSADEDLSLTETLLQADVDAGFGEWWPDTLSAATTRWGEHVAVGKLALILQPGKNPRLVGDSTAAGANQKARIHEKIQYPTIAGPCSAMEICNCRVALLFKAGQPSALMSKVLTS